MCVKIVYLRFKKQTQSSLFRHNQAILLSRYFVKNMKLFYPTLLQILFYSLTFQLSVVVLFC